MKNIKREKWGHSAAYTHVAQRHIFLLFAFLFLLSVFPALAAEPYFITIQKLELKNNGGEWVSILEPDHKVDLVSTEASVSFFNNGRVPAERFKNFRLSFDDHGKSVMMSRAKDLETPFQVKKGSFVNVSFELDLETKKVKETRLTVDEQEFVDAGDNIEISDKGTSPKG